MKTLDDLAAGQPALSTLQGCDLLVVPPGSQGGLITGFISSGPVIIDPSTGHPIAPGISCRVSGL